MEPIKVSCSRINSDFEEIIVPTPSAKGIEDRLFTRI